MVNDKGAKEINAEISRKTREEVKKILGEAKREAEKILGEARDRAKLEEEAITARGNHLAQQEKQRILADARIRARRKKMDVEEFLVQTVFKEAKEFLVTLANPGREDRKEYKDVLSDLIAEASAAIDGNVAEIIFSENDSKFATKENLSKIGKKVSKKRDKKISLVFAKETISTIGGVIVRSKDGNMEINNTFETRIKRLEDTLRPEVAEILFGK